MSKRRKVTRRSIHCPNPFCHQNGKVFATEGAFTNHLSGSQSCMEFALNRRSNGMVTLQSPQAYISTSQLHETFHITSTRPVALLRRDMVNTLADSILDPTNAVDVESASRSIGHLSNHSDAYPNDNGDFQDAGKYVITQTTHPPDLPTNAFIHTTDQKWTVALLKLLDDMNAPDYAFTDLLLWARAATDNQYSFHPVGGVSRNKHIDALFASVPNATLLLPSVLPVACPDGALLEVIVYDFVPQLRSLLQNRHIMKQDNLVLDVDNPLTMYRSPGNVLGEALSESVYESAYHRYITDPSRQLFVPIIQWIDCTSVTGNDRFSLKPYIFTPAIFTEKFRHSIQA
jgi:hypothetical protein